MKSAANMISKENIENSQTVAELQAKLLTLDFLGLGNNTLI